MNMPELEVKIKVCDSGAPKRVYIFVNGILCRPGDSHLWNSRAVTWIHRHTDDRAEKFEYFCTAIGRAFFQKNRAERLADLIAKYTQPDHKFEIVLVGHSNGTDLILKALAMLGWPPIKTVHLVSAACQEDFETNGLNSALKECKIGRVFVWMSGNDSALHLAKCRLGKLLGYGTLGLDGPFGVIDLAKVIVRRWPARDHSDCFKPYAFAETMRGFLEPEPVV